MSTLRRLIDLPGIADLEFASVMKPAMREPGAQAEFPKLDEVSRANFGLTLDEADAVDLPADWDRIDRKPERDQVEAFEAAGWDVPDKRRPLKILPQFSLQLWLAIRGVAGSLPYQAEEDVEAKMQSSLAADAAKFRRDR